MDLFNTATLADEALFNFTATDLLPRGTNFTHADKENFLAANPFFTLADDIQLCKNLCYARSLANLNVPRSQACTGFQYHRRLQRCHWRAGLTWKDQVNLTGAVGSTGQYSDWYKTDCYSVQVELSTNFTADPVFTDSGPHKCCGGNDLNLTYADFSHSPLHFGETSGPFLSPTYFAHGKDEDLCKQLCYQNSVYNNSLPFPHLWCRGFTWDSAHQICRFRSGWVSDAYDTSGASSVGGSSCSSESVRCVEAPKIVEGFADPGGGIFSTKNENSECNDETLFEKDVVLVDGTESPYYPRGGVGECQRVCWENSLLDGIIAEDVRTREGFPNTPTYCAGFDWERDQETCRW